MTVLLLFIFSVTHPTIFKRRYHLYLNYDTKYFNTMCKKIFVCWFVNHERILIVVDAFQSIWVCEKKGIHRINITRTWLSFFEMTTFVFPSMIDRYLAKNDKQNIFSFAHLTRCYGLYLSSYKVWCLYQWCRIVWYVCLHMITMNKRINNNSLTLISLFLSKTFLLYIRKSKQRIITWKRGIFLLQK